MSGMLGHGDAFVMRDPNGIRPAYYYQNDEFVVAASERPAIQTVFNVPFEEINEVLPGHSLIIKKSVPLILGKATSMQLVDIPSFPIIIELERTTNKVDFKGFEYRRAMNNVNS